MTRTGSAIQVHETEGAADGPTLAIVAGINGDEVASIQAARRVIGALSADQFRGRVLIVPVANPPAVQAGTRVSPDGLVMSRAFPGSASGSPTERLADALGGELLPRCDALIQLHSANMLCVVDFVYRSRLRPDLSAVFGSRVIASAAPPAGTLATLAEERGVPSVVVELGGGRRWAAEYVDRAVEGVRNVMVALGMVDGALLGSPAQLEVSDLAFVTAPFAGLVEPHVPIGALGSELAPRAPLGTIVDLHGSEAGTVLEARYDRAILLMAPEYDTKVEAGEIAFIVADAATAVPVQAPDNSPHKRETHEEVQVSAT